MKVAASDGTHRITSSSIAISAQDGPVTIESCSDKGGFSVLSSGPVRIESGSSSVVMTGNGDRSAIRIDPGQGGDVLVFSGNEEDSTLMGLRAGRFELFSGDPSGDAAFNFGPEGASFRIGLPGVGSSIVMTGETISLKVGAVELKISKEGIQAKTPGAKLELSQTGINEEAGFSSRKLSSEGHTLAAAESRISIDAQKVTTEGIEVRRKGELEVNDAAALFNASAQATLTARSPLTQIN